MKNNEIHTWDRGYDDDGNQVRFCSLICFKLDYLHEYLTALVSVEIKAKKKKKNINGSVSVLLGTGLGSEGRSLRVQVCSCL